MNNWLFGLASLVLFIGYKLQNKKGKRLFWTGIGWIAVPVIGWILYINGLLTFRND